MKLCSIVCALLLAVLVVKGTEARAEAVWTLGAAGPQRALAVEANLSGSPIAFSATARKPEGDSGAE